MPSCDPPSLVKCNTGVLEAGTILWRIHSTDRNALDFNPTVPGPNQGGRFDTTDGSRQYCYFGETLSVAVAEVFCRDRADGSSEPKILRRALLRNKSVSSVRVAEDIDIGLIHGSHLSAIGQDTWLTKCSPDEYPITRMWADSMVKGTDVGAFRYRSRHDEDQFCYWFTSEIVPNLQFPVPSLNPHSEPIDLSTDEGIRLISLKLSDYNVVLL